MKKDCIICRSSDFKPEGYTIFCKCDFYVCKNCNRLSNKFSTEWKLDQCSNIWFCMYCQRDRELRNDYRYIF